MLLRPELAALRLDDTPQRRAQAALIAQMDAWRARDQPAAVLADLQRFEQGLPLGDCPALVALFAPGDPSGSALVAGLISATLAQLSADPLGHVAMRHSTDGITSTLLLGQSGLATLTLVAIDGVGLARSAAPRTINYAPGEAFEQILAGSARAEMVRCVLGDGPLESADALLERGKLIHRAAASPAQSRYELMIALLGRMGRADAAPLLASMALGPDPAPLRWQALRECLGLDTATGFAALSQLARRAGDPLAAPAGALRAQLRESYPQLAQIEALEEAENIPCPA